MPQINKVRRRPRLVGTLSAILMLGTAAPGLAFDPNVEDEVRFQIECAILMLTDPVAHVEICNPGPINDPLKSLADPSDGTPPPAPPKPQAPPPPPPPPPPPVVEECPAGQVPTPCGCAYPEA